jgi:hypothetical protein
MSRSDECPSPFCGSCRWQDANGDCHYHGSPRPCERDGEEW